MPPARLPADLTIVDAIDDFARDLRLDKSPKTIATYCEAARLYARHASIMGITHLRQIDAASVRAWLTDLRERGRSQGTLFNRHSGLKAFLRWAVDEHLIAANPVAEIPVPAGPAPPVPVLSPTQLRALIKTTDGMTFEHIRDAAILRLLIDTGMRRAECGSLTAADIDLDQDVALVTGKGGRMRGCPFGARTAKAMRRYLRVRQGHEYAHRPELWLGRRGPINHDAILHLLRRRAREAGIEGRVFVHQLRHTWAHEALQRMNESDVQRLGGWRDRDMLQRYGASGADERARRAYREHSLGDRL